MNLRCIKRVEIVIDNFSCNFWEGASAANLTVAWRRSP